MYDEQWGYAPRLLPKPEIVTFEHYQATLNRFRGMDPADPNYPVIQGALLEYQTWSLMQL